MKRASQLVATPFPMVRAAPRELCLTRFATRAKAPSTALLSPQPPSQRPLRLSPPPLRSFLRRLLRPDPRPRGDHLRVPIREELLHRRDPTPGSASAGAQPSSTSRTASQRRPVRAPRSAKISSSTNRSAPTSVEAAPPPARPPARATPPSPPWAGPGRRSRACWPDRPPRERDGSCRTLPELQLRASAGSRSRASA